VLELCCWGWEVSVMSKLADVSDFSGSDAGDLAGPIGDVADAVV
jgi:hypothetical protein